MPKLHPIILDTIQNTTDSETYNIAITAVSEVATAIESEFIPYSKFYVPVLISHVRYACNIYINIYNTVKQK